MVEHRSPKPSVAGSNPAAPASRAPSPHTSLSRLPQRCLPSAISNQPKHLCGTLAVHARRPPNALRLTPRNMAQLFRRCNARAKDRRHRRQGVELPGEDSNLGQRIQSPLCYHYTTGQCQAIGVCAAQSALMPRKIRTIHHIRLIRPRKAAQRRKR